MSWCSFFCCCCINIYFIASLFSVSLWPDIDICWCWQYCQSLRGCVCVCVYMVGFLWPACVRCCFCRCTEYSQRKVAVKRGEGERKHSSLSHLSPVCLWFRMCTWMNASCVPVASLNRFVSQVPVANWHLPPLLHAPPSLLPCSLFALSAKLSVSRSHRKLELLCDCCQVQVVSISICGSAALKSLIFIYIHTHTRTLACMCVYSHYSYALTWHKKFNGQLMKPPSDSWDVDWLLLLFFSCLLAE